MQRRAQSHRNKVTMSFLETGHRIRSELTQEFIDYRFLIFSILMERIGSRFKGRTRNKSKV